MWNNIPEELRLISQWVVWKYENVNNKPTKVPYNAQHHYGQKKASHSDPATWSSFEIACEATQLGYDGIGFVFSEDDPYTFIDLDDAYADKDGSPPLTQEEKAFIFDRQLKICNAFDSYTEFSPSGRGLHIIVKGNVISGRKRNKIEIYSSHRFATFTGNIYQQYRPIAERQDFLHMLWREHGGPAAVNVFAGDEQRQEDHEIIQIAHNAENGAKFSQLHLGEWENIYPSQSEADMAYINIISFYTRNREQIARIFHASPLGKRKKAHRGDYVSWMIDKSFDNIPPPVDIEGYTNSVHELIARNKVINLGEIEDPDDEELPEPPDSGIEIPPGLMGEITKFIYFQAPRQVQEIALAGAIGLMSAICGRAYNVSDTGLNHYILVIARTGRGKEAAQKGITRLINELKMRVPTASSFIGPSEIASGQALAKYMHKNPCFISILGEYGLRLASMANQNKASNHETTLRRHMLDLYGKSGSNDQFSFTIHSDSDKNSLPIKSPNFSLLCESTAHTFFGNISESMISEGFLPRFTIIEYKGKRPPLNETHHMVKPTPEMMDRLASLAANCEMLMHKGIALNIQYTPDADKLQRRFNKFCDREINKDDANEVLSELWNRAHLKMLKLAALVAVGINYIEPIIDETAMKWAMTIVQRDIQAMVSRFNLGDIGEFVNINSNELKQQQEVWKIIKQYTIDNRLDVSKYGTPDNLFRDKIIPYSYISRRLISIHQFKMDKRGATQAIKMALQQLVEMDKIREVPRQELQTKYHTAQKCYVVKDLMDLNRD